MRSLRRNKTGVVVGILYLLCLALGATAIYDASFSDMEQVKDVDREIPDFMFDCLEHPWINPCNAYLGRKYLMLFDSRGNYIKESLNKTDETKSYLSASLRKKARKPGANEIKEGKKYPPFLLQLEREDYSSGTYYIATSSGKLLVAGNESLIPSLHLKEDHCTSVSYNRVTNITSSTTVSPITTTTSSDKISSSPTSNATTMAPFNNNISTLSPMTSRIRDAGYTCKDQALWTLWKVEERFLVIQSVHKEGFFLYVDVGDRKLTLNGGIPEMMTGIKSSFLSNRGAHTDGKYITLERTDGEAEPGIGREDYGDVVVHYFYRDGTEKKGYICDYEWGLEDANSVCRHLGFEAGMPTYDGRYSSEKSPEYAMSGVSCDSEDFETCKFRTICGTSDPSCLVQQSMKQFRGKGYACNKGSDTDVAGVICGNQTQILKIIQEKMTCNRGTIGNDNNSAAKMYSINNQIQKVGSKMFENKHWSEYLLPMPMAVSLMSTLLLVSSQFDRDVELIRPASGKWDHLKYDYLQPNLLFLSHHMKNNFMLSNANMRVIKVNSGTIHENLKDSVSHAFSSDEYDNKVLLKRTLRYISEDAQTNKDKAEEVSDAFKTTGNIISEFLEALKNSDSNKGNVKGELENALEMVRNKNEKDGKKLEEEKKKKQEYDTKVDKSRKLFFDAAKSAMNAMCVDEVTECNNCMYQEAIKTEQCKPKSLIRECMEHQQKCVKEESFCAKFDSKVCANKVEYCAEYEQKCAESKNICTGGYSRSCKKYDSKCSECHGWFYCDSSCSNYCTAYENHCNKEDTKCIRQESVCKRKEQRCASFKTECVKMEQKCIKYENICVKTGDICTDPIYEPEVNGNYCQDEGKRGKLCSKCKWIDEVEKSLESVADIQMQIQMEILTTGGSYSGVTAIAADLVSQMDRFNQDVQNYKLWKEGNENSHIDIGDDVTAPTIGNETTTAIGDIVTESTTAIGDIVTETTTAIGDLVTAPTISNEIPEEHVNITNLEAKAKRNIKAELKLMKLMFEMNIDLLSENNIPIGSQLKEYLLQLKAFVEDLIRKKIETVDKMTDIERNKVTTLLTLGKVLLKKAEELQEKNEITIKPGAADHKTGEQAGILIENLTKRHKTEKNIESLTNKMSSSIREILAKEIQTQDVKATIVYLRECFKHLNFLQAQWDTLKDFFQNLTDFLELMKKDIRRMKDLYDDLGVKVPRHKLSSKVKQDLQTKTVEALANNIYVMRIAFFYTKIAEDGILTKMSQIGNDLGKINNPQTLKRYKKYIEDEALMTQDRIKKYVSKEEANLNDKITKEVSSMKNVLACNLEDAENLAEETRLTLASVDNILSQENVNENVKVTTASATPTEIKDMGILDDVKVDLNDLDIDIFDYM